MERNFLEQMLKSGQPVLPAAEQGTTNGEEVKLQQSFANNNIMSGKELIKNEIKDLPMLVEDLIPKGTLGCLFGSSSIGKSTMARQLLIATALDMDFLSKKVFNQDRRNCVYISSEDGVKAMSVGIKKQATAMGLTDEQVESLDNTLFMPCPDNLQVLLPSLMNDLNPVLVVVDVFLDTIANKSTDIYNAANMRREMQIYSDFAEKYDCTFLLIHHSKKGADNTITKNSALGSVGMEQKMRFVLQLTENEKDPAVKYLSLVKNNYSEFQHQSLSLEFKNMLFTATSTEFINSKSLNSNKVSNAEIMHIGAVIADLREQGKTWEEVATKTGLSERVAHRRLKSYNELKGGKENEQK
ncbi:MAG: AAA family ATPase [Bacteroidales bacterium]|nr:AAA family ATPase [Bacteroidales bacterium]